MEKLTTFKKVTSAVIILLAVIIFYGCGGGGGGGSSSGINYTGVTTQATIDENNAFDIAVEAVTANDKTSSLNVLGAAEQKTTSQQTFLLFDISQYLQEVIYKIEVSLTTLYIGAIQSDSGTISGGCGGNFTYNLSVNDVTGDFNGTIKFNNYCEEGIKISGNVNVSGNININTEEITYLAMTFTNIQAQDGQESIGMNGSMDFLLGYPSWQMIMSLVIKDNNLNKVYKYENVTYNYTEYSNYIEFTFTGRFYHEDYGYVTMTTLTPFRITDYDYWPSSGSAIGEGSSGTKTKLTIIDSSSFFVEADTDGDGSFTDYNSGPISWSSLL